MSAGAGKSIFWAFVILSASFMFMIGGCSYLFSKMPGDISQLGGPVIGLVKLEDAIMGSEKTLTQLRKLHKDNDVKAIIVRVNSPGGAVGSSQEINEYIKRIKKDSIPVVASYGDIAASGGLYSTLACNKIFANKGTLTGSIGVITQFPQASKMLDKVGLEFTTIKSGELKDAGSPFRKATSEDKAYFQSVIDETYDQFVAEILEHRAIPKAELMKVADGRVLTGDEAYRIGLIDSVGTIDDAREWLVRTYDLDYNIPFREIKPKAPLIEQIMGEPVSSVLSNFVGLRSKVWYLAQ